MRIITTIAALATIATGLLLFAPAVGALDIGCVRADASGNIEVTTLPAGSATLFTPPGSDVTGWTPECVIVPLGGTVTFAQRDGIAHGVVSNEGLECIKLGRMNTLGGTPAAPSSPATTSLKLEEYDPEGSYFLMNGAQPNFCAFEVQDNVMTIPYFCEVHGQGMPGIIKVEL